MKLPVVKENEFTIYLEEYEGNTFIHCDINTNWNKKVKNKLKIKFKEMTKLYRQNLYANHPKGDEKHKKFLKMFGFEYLNSFLGKDNNNYDIYIWRNLWV